jgi:hypothetical protein
MATLKKKLTSEQKSFIDLLIKTYGPVVSRKQVLEVANGNTEFDFPWWLLREPFKSFRARRGHYNLESILAASETLVELADVEDTDETISETVNVSA